MSREENDAWREGFRREEKLRQKEKIRDEKMQALKRTTYKWVGLAGVALAVAAGAIIYINNSIRSAFDPYDDLLLILGVFQLSLLLCTMCMTLCIVVREACSQYYFAMALLIFAMLNLILGLAGVVVFYVNQDTPFALDSSSYDDHHMRLSYVVGAFVAMLFLFGSGVLGLRLFALSQENYYEDKARKFQCCFNFSSADQDEDDKEIMLGELNTEEQESVAEERHGNLGPPSIDMVLQLQQHQRVVDGDDYIHFWKLADLGPVFEVSSEEMELSTEAVIEKSRGVIKRHNMTYAPVLLLKRAYLRSEVWVQHLWGTALALAYIEHEISKKIEEPSLLQVFEDIILQKHANSSWESLTSLDEAELTDTGQKSAMPNVLEAAAAEEISTALSIKVEDETDCSASRECWYHPVIQATEYMYFTLGAARAKRDVRTTVPEWLNVAREYVTHLP